MAVGYISFCNTSRRIKFNFLGGLRYEGTYRW